MIKIKSLKKQGKKNKKQAATMVEYLLVVSLVSIAAVGALMVMSGHMKGVFSGIADKLQPVNQVLEQAT
ncbi:MAG: hypothetical protein A2287_02995 [Candidatus Melainabacteria bacterium RIFOXYA12_FULL_32_12]|nr:MAG: hypothetical protein A2255_06705 [Candidatus Melainabacteria bacterium RIFOXYA2_FULL_32_9]OGI29349.1 MAG: hypothetical protein A2287_02995 [Candidatus Melainabacteria bacterium RIFOXYA12_FULL_32_12]